MNTDFDRVKAAAPLPRVLERRGHKTGGAHVNPAPCCGHKDCFSINAEKGVWNCFSCGRGGSAIDLVMITNGVDERGALEALAGDFGVRLEKRNGGTAPTAPELTARQRVWAAAIEVFHASLMADVDGALEWQTGRRGHFPETLTKFRVGWAAGGLADRMEDQGFKKADLREAGLLVKNEEEKEREFFRQCFVYPSFDAVGRPLHLRCKFRPGPDGKKRAGYQLPNEKRHKDWVAYNQAALARREDRILVCEGEDDLLTWHESGFPNVVATCGGPSKEQLNFFADRHGGKTWLLAYDNDAAGRGYVERFAKRGMKVRELPAPGTVTH